MLRPGATQLILGLGKQAVDKLAKAFLKLRAIHATRLGKQESAPIQVVANFFLLPAQVGSAAAAEKRHGGLQQVINRGRLQVDDLPGHVESPQLLRASREMGNVAFVIVPILVEAMF